jgi:hypothetical protein
MVVIDLQTKAGTVVRLAEPSRIPAAAADSGCVYLLSDGAVLKTDPTGQCFPRTNFGSGEASSLLPRAVTGNSFYLADKSGHVARFRP